MLTVYGTDLKNRTGSSNSFAMSTVLMPIDGHLGKSTRSSVKGKTYSFDKKAFNENCYNNKVLL